MKVVLDTNVYVFACRSEASRAHFRSTFFPLLPVTFLAAVVAYEMRVDAADRLTQRLVQEFIVPMERSGRCIAPTFADWIEAAAIVTAIGERDRGWRSKLPALLNDILIALCARRIGATLLTYSEKDFRLIRRHKEFDLRVLAADAV
jgi:predicted nucleic acid-binding protein